MPLTRWQQERQPRIRQELARIVDALRPLGAERIVLFGSHARGDFNEASDIDLLIVLDMERRRVERTEIVLEAIDSEFTVEPHVYTPREFERLKAVHNPLVEAAEREGEVLYERPR